EVDRLPLSVSAGASGYLGKFLLLTADVFNEPNDAISQLRFGAEYTLSVFAFRLGYDQRLQGSAPTNEGVADRLRGGLGLRWLRYRADYTLAPFGDLGLTQRFTLGLTFGAIDATAGPENLKP